MQTFPCSVLYIPVKFSMKGNLCGLEHVDMLELSLNFISQNEYIQPYVSTTVWLSSRATEEDNNCIVFEMFGHDLSIWLVSLIKVKACVSAYATLCWLQFVQNVYHVYSYK